MRKVLLGPLASATMASTWVASISPVSAQQAAPQQGGLTSGSVSVPIVHLGSTPPLTSLSGSSSRATSNTSPRSRFADGAAQNGCRPVSLAEQLNPHLRASRVALDDAVRPGG